MSEDSIQHFITCWSAARVIANLQRATRLRQSILQKAFTGELCVR